MRPAPQPEMPGSFGEAESTPELQLRGGVMGPIGCGLAADRDQDVAANVLSSGPMGIMP